MRSYLITGTILVFAIGLQGIFQDLISLIKIFFIICSKLCQVCLITGAPIIRKDSPAPNQWIDDNAQTGNV